LTVIAHCAVAFQLVQANTFQRTQIIERFGCGKPAFSSPVAVLFPRERLDHCVRDVADAAPTSLTRKTLRRTYGTTLHLRNSRNETAHQSFSDLREVPMTSQAIEGVCAFAWRNYLLINSGISEHDNRRSALFRYVTNLRDTGEYDFDLLQIAAVAYLKKLDELHDDRGARLAADQALAERLESRNAQPGT
jgi:hypothetical protein